MKEKLLEQAKEIIANQHGFKSWKGMMINLSSLNSDKIISQVAKKYNELMYETIYSGHLGKMPTLDNFIDKVENISINYLGVILPYQRFYPIEPEPEIADTIQALYDNALPTILAEIDVHPFNLSEGNDIQFTNLIDQLKDKYICGIDTAGKGFMSIGRLSHGMDNDFLFETIYSGHQKQGKSNWGMFNPSYPHIPDPYGFMSFEMNEDDVRKRFSRDILKMSKYFEREYLNMPNIESPLFSRKGVELMLSHMLESPEKDKRRRFLLSVPRKKTWKEIERWVATLRYPYTEESWYEQQMKLVFQYFKEEGDDFWTVTGKLAATHVLDNYEYIFDLRSLSFDERVDFAIEFATSKVHKHIDEFIAKIRQKEQFKEAFSLLTTKGIMSFNSESFDGSKTRWYEIDEENLFDCSFTKHEYHAAIRKHQDYMRAIKPYQEKIRDIMAKDAGYFTVNYKPRHLGEILFKRSLPDSVELLQQEIEKIKKTYGYE